MTSIAFQTYKLGVHRELGAHISNVMCLELDVWENEALIEHILRIGNTTANQNWLARKFFALSLPEAFSICAFFNRLTVFSGSLPLADEFQMAALDCAKFTRKR